MKSGKKSKMKLTEKIGADVLAALEKRKLEIKKNSKFWKQEGSRLRKIREKLRISRNQVKKHVGCADSVLKRLEEGEFIKRRNVIVQSYKTSLNLIALRGISALESLNF